MYDRYYYSGDINLAINQAITVAKTEYVWLLHNAVDYTSFNLRFVPSIHERNQCHIWSSHNNINSHTTWLIPINHYNENIDKNFHNELLPSNLEKTGYQWKTDDRIDYNNFNFDWLPDSWDSGKNHAFAMKGTSQLAYTFLHYLDTAETVYHVSNLTFKPNAAANEWHWETDDRIDYNNFNFDWLPDAWDADKIHCFPMRGTEKLSYTKLTNLKHSCTEEKYHSCDLWFKTNITKINNQEKSSDEWVWIIDDRIDYSNFNFDWLPDAWDIEYAHCFTMQGTEQLSYTRLINQKHFSNKTKYHTSSLKFKPNAADNEWVWVKDSRIDYSNFDFNWLPDAWDVDKIHCFTMKGCKELNYTTLTNKFNGTTKKKFHSADLTFKPNAAANEWHWETDDRIDYSNFDFSWLPDAWDLDKVHCFTMKDCKQLHYTKLINKTVKQTTEKYHSANLTFKPNAAANEWHWETDDRIDYSNFNFDWLPDSWDIKKTHCFSMRGTKELCYTTLKNLKNVSTENKFYQTNLTFKQVEKLYWPEKIEYEDMYDWVCKQSLNDEWIWICDNRVNYDDFDFNWLPDVWDKDKIHCITMKNQKQLSYTWLVNRNGIQKKDFKYHRSNLKFAKDHGNKIFWPNFLTTVLSGFDWQDSLANWVIEQDFEKEYVWIVDSRINYDDFDFNWLPDAWDREYIHCFSMKDKKQLSYTWLVNTKALNNKKFKYHESNLGFVESNSDIVLLDMGHNLESFEHYNKKIRFVGTMEAMLHSAIKRANKEWLYVISSCCNYNKFTFNWLPDLDQISYAHCWPSNEQTKGDTFLIHVPTFLRTNKLDYNFDHESIQRIPWPAKIYVEDNLSEALNKDRLSSLYVVYYKQDSVIKKFPTPSLWDKRPVVSMSECNSVSLVPRDCIVKKELYEYPYLDRKTDCAKSCTLDVIFIHNGEKDSIVNLSHCQTNMPNDMTLKISSGVNGRLKAYQAAAELSNGDWFLAVFAKCHIKDNFVDFSWRPDYWQQPKHYIFHNHNYDLDLTYGHMAPIAYNKKLMLENKGGLDMTLAQEHAVVPVVLSETRLTDPWDTWRTAFRETVKLLYYAQTDNSIELQYRLDRWLNAEIRWNKHNPWYQYGSQDAKNFFESVDGQWHWIMMTNEWDWLRKKFNTIYAKDDLTT